MSRSNSKDPQASWASLTRQLPAGREGRLALNESFMTAFENVFEIDLDEIGKAGRQALARKLDRNRDGQISQLEWNNFHMKWRKSKGTMDEFVRSLTVGGSEQQRRPPPPATTLVSPPSPAGQGGRPAPRTRAPSPRHGSLSSEVSPLARCVSVAARLLAFESSSPEEDDDHHHHIHGGGGGGGVARIRKDIEKIRGTLEAASRASPVVRGATAALSDAFTTASGVVSLPPQRAESRLAALRDEANRAQEAADKAFGAASLIRDKVFAAKLAVCGILAWASSASPKFIQGRLDAEVAKVLGLDPIRVALEVQGGGGASPRASSSSRRFSLRKLHKEEDLRANRSERELILADVVRIVAVSHAFSVEHGLKDLYDDEPAIDAHSCRDLVLAESPGFLQILGKSAHLCLAPFEVMCVFRGDLDLVGEYWCGSTQGVCAAVAAAISANCSALSRVDLRERAVGTPGFAKIAPHLKSNTVLCELNVAVNAIGAEGARLLGDALKFNKCLTKLNLASNAIGDAGTVAISEGLARNATIQCLDVRDNKITHVGAKKLAESLANLIELSIEANKIGAAGLSSFGTALASNNNLANFNVRANGLGKDGIRHLADALSSNSTLRVLNIQHNDLGAEGARHLARGLGQNRSVVELDMEKNHVGPQGAAMIASALETNRTLRILILWYNDVGDEGAARFALALTSNRTLTSLDLWFNAVGTKGAVMLAKMLETNDALTTLNLRRNNIDDNAALILSSSLLKNSSLTSLDLRHNKMTTKGIGALQAIPPLRIATPIKIDF
ncbi:hypothetical protein CTAYLR_001316 [Chrysophaeum taylorii]|uniref:EF-hand domain-containing protein n=1 Tax=Chrysophaeum taylorii TaxID=2483200 RepID=A0AAD7U7I8_9STRA|nr:hypothetical protein CTAYLR_001316 [Chrysophaeum taylorii]